MIEYYLCLYKMSAIKTIEFSPYLTITNKKIAEYI